MNGYHLLTMSLLSLSLWSCEAPPAAPALAPAPAAPVAVAPEAPVSAPEAALGALGEEPEAPPAPLPAAPEPLREGEGWTPAAFASQWSNLSRVPEAAPQKETFSAAMRERWRGRTLRWTGLALAGLCVPARRRCAVNPFERGQIDPKHLPALGGFYPQVDFTSAAWDQLRARCQGREDCVVTFTGRLTEVITEPGRPPLLVFSEASVEGARAPSAQESWFGGVQWTKPRAEGKKTPIPTGAPSPVRLSLKPRVF